MPPHSAEFVTGFARLKVQPAGSTRIPAIHETFGGGGFLWIKGVTLRGKCKAKKTMAIISMFYGLVIYMYFADNKRHHTPHIHVKYQDENAVFSIPDGHLPEAV
jgi:hypothetical protein